ncbi:MAG: serine hydrolase [Vicinamibacterales bacterium]|nr:serine hydrolase [Vicinamibacterales bacterium]
MRVDPLPVRRAGAVVTVLAGLALTFAPASARQDVAPAALAGAAEAAAKLPRLHSLLVSHRGTLVLERYYNGTRPSRPANVKSVSKSVISALVGIAVDRGHITSLEQPIADFLPEMADAGAGKRAIRIVDLLTMQSGLESTSGRNYGSWVQSRNWVRDAVRRPLLSPPGTEMDYSTGSSHLLSAILTRATKQSTWQFAQEALARPLGFSLARWPQDPQGIYFGGNDMLMTPRQMVAFGELYLGRGRVGDTRVVPGSYVDASFVPRGQSRWGSDRYYGYGWWIRDLAGHPTFYAWGYGGQFIFVVPTLDLVVTTTSVSTPSPDRQGHNRSIYRLVEDEIVKDIRNLVIS